MMIHILKFEKKYIGNKFLTLILNFGFNIIFCIVGFIECVFNILLFLITSFNLRSPERDIKKFKQL